MRGGGPAAGPRLLPHGNDVYAEENGSFGLTTLERRHVRRHQDQLIFSFVGKSGVEHEIDDRRRGGDRGDEIMRRRRTATTPGCCPTRTAARGASLLPDLVNDYVRVATGLEATAKDFRTWHATVLAAAALAETPEPGPTKASRKRAVAGAMKEVAAFLGNTPTLARSSYVDPRVDRRLRAGEDHRAGHPAQLRHHRRAPGRARAGHAEAAEGVR